MKSYIVRLNIPVSFILLKIYPERDHLRAHKWLLSIFIIQSKLIELYQFYRFKYDP